MYVNFYNMAKAPFHITPDPEFLYLSASHKEALGAIIYCIAKKKGFVSVIGEVGTGKTTIVRSYLAMCDRHLVEPIYVFNPAVTFNELLKTIFRELGIRLQSDSPYDMVQQLHTVLISRYERGRNIVLLIDEAQNMPVETFEQLRILSNLETPKDKLLQIVLVGQPELAEKLAGKELRQLNQRLAIRATLRPLSATESHEYVLFRLAKVTSTPQEIFSSGALKKIIRTAQGSPRMLNILCDNALVAGFGFQERKITRAIASQVIADFQGNRRPVGFIWKYASVFGALLLSISVLNGSQVFSSFRKADLDRNKPAGPVNSQAGIERETKPPPARSPAPSATGQSQTTLLSSGPFSVSRAAEGTTAPPDEPVAGEAADREPEIIAAPAKNEQKQPEPSPALSKSRPGPRTITVRKGEHLSRICLDAYGFVNDQLIRRVQAGNPKIFDADLIFIGDTIILPELSRQESILSAFQARR
ncbi:MAG: AAA family ATPase [Proteobacteria bacterium]|nr:AAA family ATPase [Pseudomonadota bacterium]MBU1739436.1 AAA family ATPase [Pseudomonadota bacterium]